jgi:hypothetical protein
MRQSSSPTNRVVKTTFAILKNWETVICLGEMLLKTAEKGQFLQAACHERLSSKKIMTMIMHHRDTRTNLQTFSVTSAPE